MLTDDRDEIHTTERHGTGAKPQPGSASRMSPLPLGAALLAAAALMLAGCATASAPGPLTVTTAPFEPVPEGLVAEGLLPEEQSFPVLDEATARWTSKLQAWLDEQPEGGSLILEDGHSAVAVPWFGEPSPELLELLGGAPEGVTTRIIAAAFQLDELLELVQRGLRDRSGDGLPVNSGWPQADGSGVGFGIEELPHGVDLDEAAAIIAERLGRDDVPIEVEVSGPIIPAVG